MKKVFTDQETVKIAYQAWPKILRKIKKEAPSASSGMSSFPISDNKNSGIYRPFVSIGTCGCVHHLQGGCSMCSYVIRKPHHKLKESQIKKSIDQVIKYYIKANSVNKDRYYLGVGTGGSFWDPTELSINLRKYFYEQFKKATPPGVKGVFMLESRLEFVNQEAIDEAKEILGENFLIVLGYGLESTNFVIREASVHKRLPTNWQEKIKLLTDNNIFSISHIIVKPPFLSEAEAIDDVVRSVNEVFNKQYSQSVIVMVMAVKKNSAIEILANSGEYTLPSIWSIIEIIKRLGPQTCRRVTINGLAWTSEQEKVLIQKRNKETFVRGCKKCSKVLMPHLLSLKEPNSLEQLNTVIELAERMDCECKANYYQERNNESLYKNLNQRIIKGLDSLSRKTTNQSLEKLINERL